MIDVTTLPRSRAMTRSDLEAMPDNGHRYELIDGTLIVSPAPSTRHQTIVLELVLLLRNACPPELKVLCAPYDVVLAEDSVLQPDILVGRRTEFTAAELPAPPVLAGEVLSPSTRRVDLTLKRSRYEAAGCPSFWVVDPAGPTVTAWALQAGRYVEVAHVAAEEEFRTTAPYPLTIVPALLLD